ncbi:hypothetical protein DCAR_0519188 [Daucus carota subsp. sativus]|uniref:Uncharacterized protein n=1 Tax=Daucus carota subsp. sativus TaxID=79200 RepID=A0A164XSF8_DAUCS|nr:hypothetical protein DCAR_0519188 [Daucus carota subsp. sativus]
MLDNSVVYLLDDSVVSTNLTYSLLDNSMFSKNFIYSVLDNPVISTTFTHFGVVNISASTDQRSCTSDTFFPITTSTRRLVHSWVNFGHQISLDDFSIFAVATQDTVFYSNTAVVIFVCVDWVVYSRAEQETDLKPKPKRN